MSMIISMSSMSIMIMNMNTMSTITMTTDPWKTGNR